MVGSPVVAAAGAALVLAAAALLLDAAAFAVVAATVVAADEEVVGALDSARSMRCLLFGRAAPRFPPMEMAAARHIKRLLKYMVTGWEAPLQTGLQTA